MTIFIESIALYFTFPDVRTPLTYLLLLLRTDTMSYLICYVYDDGILVTCYESECIPLMIMLTGHSSSFIHSVVLIPCGHCYGVVR